MAGCTIYMFIYSNVCITCYTSHYNKRLLTYLLISTTYSFSPCDFTRRLTEPLRREKVQVGNDQENVQS